MKDEKFKKNVWLNHYAHKMRDESFDVMQSIKYELQQIRFSASRIRAWMKRMRGIEEEMVKAAKEIDDPMMAPFGPGNILYDKSYCGEVGKLACDSSEQGWLSDGVASAIAGIAAEARECIATAASLRGRPMPEEYDALSLSGRQ